MPDMRRSKCRACGKSREEAGQISWRGKCLECGPRLAAENIIDMRYHTGPGFIRWRRAMAASVGGVLLDDVAKQRQTDGSVEHRADPV